MGELVKWWTLDWMPSHLRLFSLWVEKMSICVHNILRYTTALDA
jgi:hypothetical protein